MRLWHLIAVTAVLSVGMTLAREPHTRVLLIVLVTGLAEIAFGLAAVMALFQTIGAIGEARDILEHAEAVAATTVVLTVATAVMGGVLFVGFWLVAATM